MAHRPQSRSGGDPRPMRPPVRGWLRSLLRAWAPGRGEAMTSAVPVMEEYEQRLLYSADLAPHALLSADPAQAVEQRVLDAQGDYVFTQHQATAPGVELLFVDAGVQNSDALASELSQADGRRIEVVTLDATADGIGQISAALAGRNDVAALHILSHGSDGEIRVGNGVLDVAQLAARRDEIAQWGAALAAHADILLYGCDVAAGSAGEAFVRQLSALTRADVAASNDLTGNASLGGDWALEFAAGSVEAQTLLLPSAGNAWYGTLATFVVTDKNGSGAGTLVQAIANANSTPGADIISFQLSGAGAQIVNINDALVITDTVTIDGAFNNGVLVNGGLPGVILDGGGLAANGITLADGSDGSSIRGLVIRDFAGNGIEIAAGANGNTIANNHVGNLWEDGTRAGGSNQNAGAGIHVNSLFNTIGGTAATDRNIISGNAGAGILVENPAGTSVLIAPNNEIVGNIIGMEGDGTTALPNSIGIQFRDGAQWDRVLGNNISGNTGSGILIGDSGAQVHDVLIGGSGSDGNKIALNGGDGVTVMSGLHNTILSNSISGNAGLGIDLRNNAASAGVTANDIGDADGGGNELQNFPILSSAQIVSGTQVRLIGTLNAAGGTQHLIEFFSNTAGDASGNGEGQTLLGNVTVTTNGSGNASFNTLINATLPAGSLISATATNFYTVIIIPVRGSTSEFSNTVVLGNTAPVLDVAMSPQLLSTPAGAPAPVGTAGTLVSALVDFSTPAGQLDNVTDADSGAQLGIAITGVDTANGTLYYSLNGGTGWTAVGAVSDGDALLLGADGATRLYYQANAGASGTLASAVTFRAWDRTTGASGSFMNAGINGGATAFSAAADAASLAVTGVNSAPVNTVPGTQGVNEDTALAIVGISVNDGDGNLSSTQLTVNNGVLEVNLAGGAVIVAGANTSGDLTLGGTQAQINAALATLKYQGNPNFSGSDTLRVLSTDGAATPLSDTDTITLTVNAVNDAPSSSGGSVSGSEDTPHVFTWAQFNVTDADSPITGATAVRMDVLPASGALQYLNSSLWKPVALGQVIDKSSIDAGQLRFVPTAEESGHDGYATPGVGNLLQDYARFSFAPVHTVAIAIVNPGGEANGLGEGVFQNPAVGWTTSGADAGAQNLTPLEYPLDHDASLYVNDGATLTQTLAATFSAARNYSLSFEFGWRNDDASEPGFRVELWAGATLMGAMDETAIAGVQGAFVSGVLNMVGTTSGAVEGSALQIRLVGTDLQANFDNLRLVSFIAAADIGVAAQMNVDIVPVNDAPTATNLNAAETYTEDTALNLTNIVISDIDSANVTATLTLSNAAAGSLNTATSGAVTSTYNAGTGVWTASGTIASVNALLAGVTFTPAGNFNASFSIATSVSDGVAAAVTGSKTMTGVAVNDAPTATNLNAAETFTEDTALNLTNIVVSDIDSANVTATLTLSNAAAGSLNTATAGAVTSTYNAGTGVWTASGAIASVNALLAGVTFTPAGNFNASFSIATSVSDGVAAAVTGSKTMTGVAVNDAPTATNLNAAETFTEDTALNLTNIVVSDIDSANVTAILTLSNAAAGSLNTATAGAVTSTYNAGTGVWTASGAIANVNALLAGLTFTPAANFNANFTVATSVSDGVAPALTGSKAMTGVAVNDAPTATNLNAAESYTEDTALNLTNIVISDIDSANVTATLTLSNAAAGSLNTATSGAVTSTYNAGTGVWTASGAIASVNTLLAGVTFTPTADFNGAFSIATSVSDGIAAPQTGSKAFTGVAVNDAPTATNLSAAETFTEDTALNLTNIVFSDIDSASVTATLTLSNPAAGSLNTATSGAVTSTYNAGTGVWTASGTIASVNTLLAGLTFTPAANFNGAFSFATSVSDGVAPALTGSKAITGIAVNDAPGAIIAPASFAATEQVALALQGAGLSVTDVDAGTATVHVTLSVVAGTLSATAGTTGVTLGGGGASLFLIGNINQINNLLNGIGGGTLTYVMNSDTPPATDTLTLQIDDLGNSGGGSLTAQDMAVINITAVNDAPVAVAVTLAAIAEDSGVRLITSAQLLAGVTDIDGPALTITSLAIAGGGGALIDNGNGSWSYTPALNDDSAVSFNYVASDGVSSASSTAALDITPVNDAPLAVDDVLPAAANTPLTTATTVLSGNDTDIEGTPLTVIAVGNATDGTVALAGGVVTFTPDAGFTGAAGYEYTVSDGGLADVGVVTVNVGGINTAPVANADLLAATEDVTATYTAAQLLGNDTDAEGNTLSIASVSSGAGGTVALNGDGTVTFAPGLNFNGAASFNYVASDGALTSNSAIATINVAPVNDAPASAPVALAAIAEDSGPRLITQAQLLANATDVDGPALTASGLALSSGTGTLTDNGNGTWTFTPVLNDDSGAAFSYAVSDGTLAAAASATLDITPVNDAPVNSIPGPQSVNEDTALAFSGATALSVSDVDGNLAGTRLEVGSGTLGVSLAGGATLSAGANNSTTLTLSGTSAQINAALATLTYQGLLDFNGAVTLTILSTDGAALPLADSDMVAITVNAVNDVPAISGGTGGAVTEDATLPNLTATGALTIVDADAGESSFVAQPGTVGALGMLVLNSTGAWTYTADNTQAAVQQLAAGATITDTFTAVSADGTASRAVVITFTGTNDVPLLGGTATGNVTEDAAPTLTAAGTLSIADADINESQFVAQTGAAGVFGIFTVDTGGIWSYAAASNQPAIQQLAAGATVSESFTVVSADGTASRDVVITIGGSNDAPLAASHTVAVVGSAVHVFAPGEFGYTDIDGDALATIRVTALPGSGALLLAGVPVTANQEISATDIAAGSLSFVPDAAVSSPAVTAFAFQVSDGTVYSAASYQVSLSVSPGVVRDENGITPQPGLVTPPVAAPETATAVVPAPSTAATPAPAAGGEAAGGALAPPQPAAPELPPAALLDTPGFEQGVQRSDGFAGVVRTRAADTSSTSFAAILQYALGLNVPQVRADASALPEATLGERAAAATAHSTFIGELDRLRDTAHAEEALERNIIVSSVATGAGMSVGYVLWLLRGGLLLSSLLSSLPAWRFVDPLPVLGRLRDDDDEDLDDDSVESLVQAGVQPYDAQDEDERHA